MRGKDVVHTYKAMAAALVLASCAATPPPAAPAAAAPTACPAPGRWLDGAGRPQEAEAVLAQAARAPTVLLGERHDDPDHHRWQLQVLSGLLARTSALAVGLEMLPRRVQPVLDRWTAGELSEEAFLRAVEWDRVWGFDPGFYMPVLQVARLNRLPVVALNVERALVSRTAREGWAAVPPAEREGVGDPAPVTPAYRASLAEAMAAHGGSGRAGDLDRFIEAQSVWDRAMAEKIAETHRATGRTVVALMGIAHVEGRQGVPHQLAALGLPDAAVLLPWDTREGCEALDGTAADAVFLVPPGPADAPPPRLGVRLAEEGGGVTVREVAAGSPAAAAGLKAGDAILTAGGRPVRSAGEVTAAVRRQPPGSWLPLEVRRTGRSRLVVVRFPAAPER